MKQAVIYLKQDLPKRQCYPDEGGSIICEPFIHLYQSIGCHIKVDIKRFR